MENNFISQTFKIENAAKDDKGLKIEGYACHYNQKNLNGELVDENSYRAFFGLYNEGKLRPQFNWNHTDMIIGGIDTIESKEKGLWITCHLNNDVAIVRDMIAPNVMAGDLDSFSTEECPLNGYDDIVRLENDGFYVKNAILRGVAIVSIPADWTAKFTVANYLKELGVEIEKKKDEIEKNRKWYLLI